MLKSEMQHQFWVTKKAVQRKLGSKEDEHVISSDAELDSKIEVFKSISETTSELNKIIDQYQERICVLSQEECVFGRFLKEVGKRSKTSGETMIATGKAITFSGQQRMNVRVPLFRMHHEVEVFRNRAINDTLGTINAMEKERTEYRAALSWMKSSSSALDPDTGRGLDNFRTAQSHVRASKKNFDRISLDTVQKIDLLAAARCNMYSHALMSYMTELLQFSKKSAVSFESISADIRRNPRYNFCVLKDLSQNESDVPLKENGSVTETDADQALFFANEYKDEKSELPQQEFKNENAFNSNIIDKSTTNDEQAILPLLLDTETLDKTLDSDLWKDFLKPTKIDNCPKDLNCNKETTTEKTESNVIGTGDGNADLKKANLAKSKKIHAWMNFFAELDPLSNPQEFDLKLGGGNTDVQQI